MRAPGRQPRFPALIIVTALFALALAAGCGNDNNAPGPDVDEPENSGPSRAITIGFGAVPAHPTQDAYIDTFATAARYGEVIVIQRTPPWEEFFAGGETSEETEETTQLETDLLDQYDWLEAFYAIDPTDASVQRSRVADLPPGVDPAEGFESEELRESLVNYAAYVAKNYRPAYLAIGVEINMLYERSRPQFDAFVEAYGAAYDVAKAANPGMLVFPTFQLEDLLGRLDQVHEPHWEVLDAFQGKMDALAVTTYPFVGSIQAASDIPEDYYAQLTRQFDGPILVAQAGYPSAPVEGEALIGTEQDQDTFLARLLADAETNEFAFVGWVAALDPAVPATGFTAVLKDTGLRRSDGANKIAWSTWESWALRPLAGEG